MIKIRSNPKYRNFSKRLTGKVVLLISILLFCITSQGCETVKPWEKEFLSDPNMMFDENPIEKGIKTHYQMIREGSEGANGAQSGGCGCG